MLTLHREHRDQFNYIHVGAFWSKFKELARGELGGLRDRLAPVCEQTVLILSSMRAPWRNLRMRSLKQVWSGLVLGRMYGRVC